VTGALFAFLSACLQGVNSACLRRGVLTGSASQAMAITVPMGVPLALLAAWLSGQLEGWQTNVKNSLKTPLTK
jgi:drug/metabolite transporter (DMT)-like permease